MTRLVLITMDYKAENLHLTLFEGRTLLQSAIMERAGYTAAQQMKAIEEFRRG